MIRCSTMSSSRPRLVSLKNSAKNTTTSAALMEKYGDVSEGQIYFERFMFLRLWVLEVRDIKSEPFVATTNCKDKTPAQKENHQYEICPVPPFSHKHISSASHTSSQPKSYPVIRLWACAGGHILVWVKTEVSVCVCVGVWACVCVEQGGC